MLRREFVKTTIIAALSSLLPKSLQSKKEHTSQPKPIRSAWPIHRKLITELRKANKPHTIWVGESLYQAIQYEFNVNHPSFLLNRVDTKEGSRAHKFFSNGLFPYKTTAIKYRQGIDAVTLKQSCLPKWSCYIPQPSQAPMLFITDVRKECLTT